MNVFASEEKRSGCVLPEGGDEGFKSRTSIICEKSGLPLVPPLKANSYDARDEATDLLNKNLNCIIEYVGAI